MLGEVFLTGALSSLAYYEIKHVSNKRMFIDKLWFFARIFIH